MKKEKDNQQDQTNQVIVLAEAKESYHQAVD